MQIIFPSQMAIIEGHDGNQPLAMPVDVAATLIGEAPSIAHISFMAEVAELARRYRASKEA